MSDFPMAAVTRRSMYRRIHRWLGLTLVVLLGAQCITGTVLVFEEEIECLLNPALMCTEAPYREAMPLDTVALRAQASLPAPAATGRRQLDVTRLGFGLNENAAIRVRMREREAPHAEIEAFLDPGGEVLGWRPHKSLGLSRSSIVPTLRELHTKLLAGDIGKNVLGAVAFLWLLSGATGFYLSLPRNFSWARWRFAWTLRRLGSAYELHRAGGLWLSGAASIFALTAVLLVFDDSIFGAPDKPVSGPAEATLGFDDVLAAAARHLPDNGKDYTLRELRRDPQHHSYRLDFRHVPAGGLWHRPDERLYLDAAEGALLRREGWVDAPPAERLRHLALPLHSGAVLGLPGRMAASAAALLLLVQLVAGFALWRRRSAFS